MNTTFPFDLQLFADGGEGGEGEKKYDQAYVTRLRNEIAELKAERDTIATERDTLKTFKTEVERKEHESKGQYEAALAKIQDEQKKAQEKHAADLAERDRRFILAEAKAAAIKHGIIDPNDIASLDISALKVAEDGTVDAEAFIAANKEAKPHWYKAEDANAANQNAGGQNANGGTKTRAGAAPLTNGGGGKTVDWNSLQGESLDKAIVENFGNVLSY